MRARAAWHFGRGPEYCRGCAALGRDCGQACPYAAHAPASVEGAACWAAGIACTQATLAGREIGATSDQVVRLVGGLQRVAIVSGASAQEVSSATLQLAQALASGVLQGDELRSILEAMPLLAEALAKELGTSISGLRKLGEEGKLTAERVFPALLRAAERVGAELDKAPLSLGRAFGQLTAATEGFLGQLDRAIGLSNALARALDLMLGARKPLILAGGGIRVAGAFGELRAVAEQLDIPVYTSFMGKGALPHDHPLHLGVGGVWGEYPATEAARNADVILAIGARFNDLHTGSWIKGYVYNIPPTRLIQVDIDENEIGRNYPVELGITADAKEFLGKLLTAARSRGRRAETSGWKQEIAAWQSDWRNFCAPFATSRETPIEPRRILAEMNRLSPPDTVMVDDVGNCQVWSEQYWEVHTPGNHMTAGGFAAMGFGVCGVLGARLARPHSPCVTLCGDGGFMMTPHAVATAVEYGLPAVWVMLNNYAIGTIRDLQRAYLGGRELGTSFVREDTGELWNPDFVRMTEAMGGRGIRIEHPDQFADAYAEAIRSNVPTVLDVVVNRDTGIPITGTWQMPPIPEVAPTFGRRLVRN